jgi:ribosomal protein L31
VRLKGIHPHVHIDGGKKGYTLKSTLLTMERDTLSRPHCLWKGIQPHVHTIGGGKGYNLKYLVRSTYTRWLVYSDLNAQAALLTKEMRWSID